MTGSRRERGPRLGRVGAVLLLAAAVLVPAPVLAWTDPPGSEAPASSAPARVMLDPAWVADPTAAPRALGFWLGPIDEDALRAEALEASGLALAADGTPRIRTLADARSLRRATLRVHERANRRLTAAFRATATTLGVTDLGAMRTAPLVVARVTPRQAAALAALPMVDGVEAGGDVRLAMASAYPTIGAPAVYGSGLGFRGDGVRVAVVEYARIDFSRPTLEDVPRTKLYVARRNGGYVCRDGDPRHPDASISHMTRVAAIIAGRSPLAPRGIAPGALIVQSSIDMPAYDNLETAARVVKAIECAITEGKADVINLSLSEPRRQSYVRTYLDHLVTTYGVFVVVASGNAVYGTCPDGEPVSPATAWNVLTVGGTDDRGTITHRDDRLWTENGRDAVCSADPRGQWGDDDRRIKPELSAVARNIGVAGYPLSSGTSYAAPMVSGAAATLIGRDPGLAARPHVVKAILVASSRAHRTRTPGGRLSTDREGAGTLSVDWAHAIVTGSKGSIDDTGGHGERIVWSTALAGGCRQGHDVTFTFTGHAGRTVRVAIAWNAHARRPSLSGGTQDRRKSDLDLVVRAPGGGVITGTSSSRTRLDASNLEWLDFTAPADGTYIATIEVSRWDPDLVREPVGFAWVAFPD